MVRLEWRVAQAGLRLDRYIAEQSTLHGAACGPLSRSQVQRLIEAGRVLVNGAPARPSYLPVAGDLLQVDIPEPAPAEPRAEDLPLEVVYEDAYLLVVNKPAGLVVHPAAGHPTGTLVNALLARRPDVVAADVDPLRPGIVHRLDRDTSGLMVVATNRDVQVALQALFQSRQVTKHYLALLYGHLEPERALIDAPIGRDPRHRQRMTIRETDGRAARTSYRVREYLRGSSYVEARLLTGRTHQLRVHFSSLGHAVVGDSVYGPRRPDIVAPRQMLHAWRLAFTHPFTGAALAFAVEPPEDMLALLAALRAQTVPEPSVR